jgi:hypothetical protein
MEFHINLMLLSPYKFFNSAKSQDPLYYKL